jgi:hypothetical protein
MDTVIVLLFSAVSAVLYRLGGWGADGEKKYPKIAWAIDGQARRTGCTLLTAFVAWRFIYPIIAPWWAWLLTILLSYASITTYWDFMFKNEDNFFMHGFMLGFSFLPLVLWGNLSPSLFIGRAVALSLLMGIWCEIHGNDTAEELGRGFFLTATLLIYNL